MEITMTRQQSSLPTNKVVSGTMGAAVASIVVWALGQSGMTVPGEIAGAMATIATFVFGYLTPPGVRDIVVAEGDPLVT